MASSCGIGLQVGRNTRLLTGTALAHPGVSRAGGVRLLRAGVGSCRRTGEAYFVDRPTKLNRRGYLGCILPDQRYELRDGAVACPNHRRRRAFGTSMIGEVAVFRENRKAERFGVIPDR